MKKEIASDIRAILHTPNQEEAHLRRLRTSNITEQVNRELKRRTRCVGIFPNVESCLRLVSALAAEIVEEWQTGKAYIGMGEEN